MKKVMAVLVSFAIAGLLAGCAGTAAQSASSSSASASSGASSTSSASASSAASTAASSSASSTASKSSSTQGTPKIELGDLSLLDVHEDNGAVVADAVVEVVNSGDVPLVLGAGEIKIADKNGNVIIDEAGNGIFTGPSYLRVGDVGFIYTSGSITLPNGYAANDNYLLTGTADLTACKEVYEYPVTNLKISEDAFGKPQVSGTVTNDDSETADLIELSAVYLDNDGAMMGVSSSVVVNLKPGESKDFTIDGFSLPVSCTLSIVSNYDVIAVSPKY